MTLPDYLLQTALHDLELVKDGMTDREELLAIMKARGILIGIVEKRKEKAQ